MELTLNIEIYTMMNIREFKNDLVADYKSHVTPDDANFGMTHLINLMGPNVIYVETGVHRGRSICSILQRCGNIKKAYGVDSYKSNIDTFDRHIRFHSAENMKSSYNVAKRRIIESGHKDKVTLILEDVSIAKKYFEDNSIDFLFLDHYLNEKDVSISLETWYNKVKIGGYFAGHDYGHKGVKEPIEKFRSKYSISSPFSVYGEEWVWKKEGNI